jgi:hypothetical protein
MTDIAQALEATRQGDPQAAPQLLPLVYTELRKLAAAKTAHELPGQTLQPTGLVHEAWLRVSGPGHTNFQKRPFLCGGRRGEGLRSRLLIIPEL